MTDIKFGQVTRATDQWLWSCSVPPSRAGVSLQPPLVKGFSEYQREIVAQMAR